MMRLDRNTQTAIPSLKPMASKRDDAAAAPATTSPTAAMGERLVTSPMLPKDLPSLQASAGKYVRIYNYLEVPALYLIPCLTMCLGVISSSLDEDFQIAKTISLIISVLNTIGFFVNLAMKRTQQKALACQNELQKYHYEHKISLKRSASLLPHVYQPPEAGAG